MERLLYRAEDAARLLSLSRAKVYELIARGELRCVHVGRAMRIPRQELERFCQKLLEVQQDEQ